MSKYINVGKLESYNIPILLRLVAILGSHRVTVITPDGNKIDIGRGSIGTLKCVRYYNSEKINDPILKVGEFCEFSDAKIIVGGEHKNQQAFNNTFSSLPILASFIASNNIATYMPTSKGKIEIGDFTIVSQDVTILSGSSIGKASILGAGSIVSGTIPIGSICYSNTKNIVQRKLDKLNQELIEIFDSSKLNWSQLLEIFDLYANNNLMSCIDLYNKYSLSTGILPVDTIIFDSSRSPDGILNLKNLVGVIYQGHEIKAIDLPVDFVNYLRQGLSQGDNIYWTIDAFTYFLSNKGKMPQINT